MIWSSRCCIAMGCLLYIHFNRPSQAGTCSGPCVQFAAPWIGVGGKDRGHCGDFNYVYTFVFQKRGLTYFNKQNSGPYWAFFSGLCNNLFKKPNMEDIVYLFIFCCYFCSFEYCCQSTKIVYEIPSFAWLSISLSLMYVLIMHLCANYAYKYS